MTTDAILVAVTADGVPQNGEHHLALLRISRIRMTAPRSHDTRRWGPLLLAILAIAKVSYGE
jgi:hypothetical protein